MKTSNRLNLIIDTNVFLAVFSRKSRYHWFYQKFLNNDFDISITNEILSEYEEKFSDFYDSFVAVNIINSDPDDNKFVDCAVASSADYIISHDKHFNVLKSVNFPVVKVLSIDEVGELF